MHATVAERQPRGSETTRLPVVTARRLGEVGPTPRNLLPPAQLRAHTVAPSDEGHARHGVERQRRPVRLPGKLGRNTGPVRPELREIDP